MEKIPGGLPSIVDVSKFSGNIFIVDSNVGTDAAGYGYHPDYPFDSIDYAVGQCTANQGDVILVLPGHVEAVAAAADLDLDVAGITIIFLGHGNARGQIQFGTDVGADMDVDAADITMINPRFVAAIDALTGPIDVNAARFKIIDGTCEDATDINTTDWVVADANADDIDIDGLTFIDGNAGGTQKQSFIQVAGATRPKLKRIRATGDFGTGIIENGTAWTDALLDDIVIDNTAAGPVVGILLQATSSGSARNVNVRVASGTTYVTANNDLQWFNCWGVGDDAAAADAIGTVPTASVEGKIDTLQAEVSGGAGIAAWPAAAAPANAVSLAEAVRYIVEQQAFRLATKTYTFAVEGGAQGAIDLFTVTGDVELEIFGICKDAFTTAGGAATIEVGVSGNTAVLIAQATATDLIANEIWHDATPTTTVEQVDVVGGRRFIVSGGQNVILTIATADTTAGDCTFYCRWRPLSSDGAVVAA